MRILGVSGSLRAASTNRGLLRAAHELAPPGVALELYDLRDLPPYDGDAEAAGDPETVRDWKTAIREADALLIATPEYNRGVPGVLKNAIDWASRPPLAPVLAGKPVAIMGASTGMGGTVNAQRQLRDALGFPRARVLDEPTLHVSSSYERFDGDGELVDEETREEVRGVVEALAVAAGYAAPAVAAA